MHKKNKYKRVNWISGMKVRFNMFEQTEDYYTWSLCDNIAIQLNRNNYGLLPSLEVKNVSSEFEISKSMTGIIEVKLYRCNAVTLGGCRINFDPPQGKPMIYTQRMDIDKQDASLSTKYWDIIIVADPFRRIPSGVPDENETPPRHPEADSYYGLSMSPKGKLNTDLLGMFHLVIGRVRQTGERFDVDVDFIPPCTSMSSHTALMQYYEYFGSLLNEIENSSQLIIAKIRNRKNNTSVAFNIGTLCEDMMRYIAGFFPYYRNSAMDDTPVNIVTYFSGLTRVCYVSMNFISKHEKEELLRYFYEWSDVTPGSFEELLASVSNIAYDHNDIRTVMIRIESFLRVIAELWVKLSGLEYIGKQKESIIISERISNQNQKSKAKKWNIFD